MIREGDLGIVQDAKTKECHDINPDMQIDYMRRIVQGDRAAFNDILNYYMKDIYHFAYSILGSASKAEDIVQEACLLLWNKADKWKPTGNLKSWLMRITHNLCMDEIRKRKEEVTLDITILAIPDTAPNQMQLHADQQCSQAINQALFAVPDRQRIALTLMYYHGYSNNELAFIMESSVDAVESLLARGRLKLRNLLSDSKEFLLEGIINDT